MALPVYTSRQFRHAGIFVNADAGIEKPEDLRGKVVGTPEWQLTANVWIRGTLADHYGVPVDSVEYRTGGQETPGRVEKAAVDLGERIRIQPIPEGKTLAAMLADGEIDAFQGPRVPSSFVPGGTVRRLFADPVAAEKQYFAETGIFPIMHVVVVRRDVYERHPWVAQSLTKALALAKKKAMAELYDASALRFMLPWLIPGLEEARSLLGEDYWSYGLQANETRAVDLPAATTTSRGCPGGGTSRRSCSRRSRRRPSSSDRRRGASPAALRSGSAAAQAAEQRGEAAGLGGDALDRGGLEVVRGARRGPRRGQLGGDAVTGGHQGPEVLIHGKTFRPIRLQAAMRLFAVLIIGRKSPGSAT